MARPLAALITLPLMLTAAAAASPAEDREAPYAEMSVRLLQQYLQVDTTNPPGGELAAARFLAGVLAQEGIEARIDEFAPGRANLIAVLRGRGTGRPLVLSSHMDVVPADATRWTVPPFSGARKDGFLYGRGAVDMKCEGILQLVALIRLKREGVALDRDVVFLATADEEVDFLGATRALSPQGFGEELRRAEYVITEGGENVAVSPGVPAYFSVETGEKGPFWLTLRTQGTPGHGSRPIEDSAVNRLVRALDRVRQYRPPLRVLPAVQRFFRDQAPHAGARAGWYQDLARAVADPEVARTLYEDREVSALLHNTIAITVVRAGHSTNVIPGTAEAELDVRLLPGEDPQAFLAEMRKVIDDPAVEIVPPSSFRPPNQSPPDSPLVHAVERVIARRYPGVPVTAKMLTGATESVLFRGAGASAYGFTPLVLSEAELDSQHGDDERISEEAMRKATAVFYEVVREIAGAPAP